MRDVIGGIASRIHLAGGTFVLAPPQHSQRAAQPPLESPEGGFPREGGRPGTLISSGSLPSRVRPMLCLTHAALCCAVLCVPVCRHS